MRVGRYGLAALFLVLGTGSLVAASAKISFTTPKSFIADGKEFPAGSYEIIQGDSPTEELRLRNMKTRDTIVLRFITRVAQLANGEQNIVFDVAGDKNYLAEIHFAGIDGYNLAGAPGPHTHSVIKVAK